MGGAYQINIYLQLLKAKPEIYYGRSVYRRTFSGHYKVSYGYIDKTRQPSIGSRLTGAIRYFMENAQDQTELGLSAHEIGQIENHYQAHFYAMGWNSPIKISAIFNAATCQKAPISIRQCFRCKALLWLIWP